MKVPILLTLGLCFSITMPALAQRPGNQQQSHVRNHSQVQSQREAPHPPSHRTQPNTAPRVDRRSNGQLDRSQHFRNGHWYGRPSPNDPRFHLDRPFAHGRFANFGQGYRYSILRMDRIHHWFWLQGGYYFSIAAWDWPWCANWCWECADDFVIYLDPDHPGWYLIYNMQTGTYVHAIYMGN